MTLRRKTLAIIGVTLLVLTCALALTARFIILGSFTELEEKYVSQNIHRTQSFMTENLANLNSTARDWATWDDTYAFIRDRNRKYIDTNVVESMFSTLKLNVMVFVDASGQVVLSRGYDLNTGSTVMVPKRLLSNLTEEGSLIRHNALRDEISGIVLLPEGPLFVVGCPILRSTGKGPARGSLILGRYLDTDYLKKIADANYLSLDLRRVDDPSLQDDFQSAKAAISSESPVFVKLLGKKKIAGYTVLKDVHGRPAMLLRITMTRDIYSQGLNNFYYFILSLIAVGIVLGIVIFLLLEKQVLSRLTRIGKDIRAVSTSSDLSKRVRVTGSDELSSLKDEINIMLEALESSERALRESEERYRDLFENASDLIQVVAPDGRILFVNSAWQDALGYSGSEIALLKVHDIVDTSFSENCLDALMSEAPRRITGVEAAFIARDGRRIIVEGNIACQCKNASVIATLGIFRNISERKQIEDTLRALSLRDELTGLYNRRGFLTLVEQQLKLAARMKRGLLLVFADLDGMKEINDSLGHQEGDRALTDTASILGKTFRDSDIIARYGGDEFVVLSLESDDKGADAITSRLYENLVDHNMNENRPYKLSVSVGISRYDPEMPSTVDSLLMLADNVMYEQKRHKRTAAREN
ncbi:MAG TPA: CHASE4 domain-containing protein [Thermodesulfovibrionales bacterium]|nr:CHASE4 domain-containing protein [Thermodesulfovibrionales bacterium]